MGTRPTARRHHWPSPSPPRRRGPRSRDQAAAFDFEHIGSGNRPDWFAALSPHGKVPVLQRHLIVEELAGDDLTRRYPRLRRWAEALVARASTHTFPPEEFRALCVAVLQGRGSFVAGRALVS